MTLEQQERLDNAIGQLIIALTFLVPRGTNLHEALGKELREFRDIAGALASPPAEDELQRHDCETWAMEGIGCAHCNPVALAIRAAQAPPASDPPGLVALVDKHIDGLRRAYSLDGIDVAMREMGKVRIEALEVFRDSLLPASPQAKED